VNGRASPGTPGTVIEIAVPFADPWVLAVVATPTDWVLSVAEYSIFIRPDLLQQFWQVMADGGFITDAVAVIDTCDHAKTVILGAGRADLLPGVRPSMCWAPCDTTTHRRGSSVLVIERIQNSEVAPRCDDISHRGQQLRLLRLSTTSNPPGATLAQLWTADVAPSRSVRRLTDE